MGLPVPLRGGRPQRGRRCLVLAAALLLCTLAYVLVAPQRAWADTGTVQGLVYFDENGNRQRDAGELPSPAQLSITSIDGQQVEPASYVVGEDGRFRLALPPGRYILEAWRPGRDVGPLPGCRAGSARVEILVVSGMLTITELGLYSPIRQPSTLEVALPNGRFYTQGVCDGYTGEGFAITDADGIPFWQEYQRLGGPATLGYPISHRYTGSDGTVYQATQFALLQWRRDRGVGLAPLYEMIGRQPPYTQEYYATVHRLPLPQDDGSGGNPDQARLVRLGWLTDEAIAKAFLANPNPAAIRDWNLGRAVELYGLPMAPPERRGPVIVQRFQRMAFQRWLEDGPGGVKGTVTRVHGGEIARAELVPPSAIVPQRLTDVLAMLSGELHDNSAISQS